MSINSATSTAHGHNLRHPHTPASGHGKHAIPIPQVSAGEPPKRLDEHNWSSFVRPSVKFKAEPDTRKLIDAVMPYFPKSCICIAGYLGDEDQFWKVNYHWELLLSMLGKASALKLGEGVPAKVTALRQELLANPPAPASGYKNSKVVGEPKDSSSHELITTRWQTMRKAKEAFRAIVDSEKLTTKYPPAESWDLAVAPVARPGTSKHGTGCALDIQGVGHNLQIKQIGYALGATLAFDEKSHVHVEFEKPLKV